MMYIIAEAGINHNGEYILAKNLARKAKEAGADAVKFQTFWDMGRLKKYELKKETFGYLNGYCKKIGIDFLSTPHTEKAIDFLDKYVDIFKVASPFLTNKTFLEKVDSKEKTILLSTGSLKNPDGMATIDEIRRALCWIRKSKIVLMHCVSKYPCENPHYERIEEFRSIFGVEIGLSDHSRNLEIDVDVPYLEKHMMLHHVNSIDENVSLYPEEFEMMVNYIRRRENEKEEKN